MAKVLIFDSEDMDEAAVQELVAFMKQGTYRKLTSIDMPATLNNQMNCHFLAFGFI